MVKIQIDIPKEQNERFEILNKQMALSKAKTVVLLLKKIFELSKKDFEDLVLGRVNLGIKPCFNITFDNDIKTYKLDWTNNTNGTTEDSSDVYIGDLPQNTEITYTNGTNNKK